MWKGWRGEEHSGTSDRFQMGRGVQSIQPPLRCSLSLFLSPLLHPTCQGRGRLIAMPLTGQISPSPVELWMTQARGAMVELMIDVVDRESQGRDARTEDKRKTTGGLNREPSFILDTPRLAGILVHQLRYQFHQILLRLRLYCGQV